MLSWSRARVGRMVRRIRAVQGVAAPSSCLPLSHSAPSQLAAPVAAPARALSSSFPDHTVLEFPALSPTMETGTLSQWFVEEGGLIAVGEPILEVETDKAGVSMDAQDEGYLAKILVPAGTAGVQIGTAVGVMVEEPEDVAAFANFSVDDVPSAAAPTPSPAAVAAAPAAAAPPAVPASAPQAPQPALAPAVAGGPVAASPLARKLAREAGVDIGALAGLGTALDGRICAADVEDFIAQGGVAPAAVADPAVAAAAAAAQGPVGVAVAGAWTDVAHSPTRRATAERLTASKREVPHFYLTSEVCLDQLMSLRSRLGQSGVVAAAPSLSDFVVKASALAMKRVPEVNSSWLSTAIRQHHDVNIAVNFTGPEGSMAATIRHVERLGLAEVAAAAEDLSARSQSGELSAEDLAGATFTITNLGAFKVKSFSPIVAQPQACSLGVGTASWQLKPPSAADAEAGKQFSASLVMNVTLSCDHRVVDGAVGAQWLAVFKELLEQPETMLL